MTREKVKQMVKAEVLNFDRDYGLSSEEVAERIMKIWDQGWTWDVTNKTSHDDGYRDYGENW